MADADNNDEAPPEETVADVLTGEPKDPDSPNHGASFRDATQGNASRALPPKKKPAPKAEKGEGKDDDKGDDKKADDKKEPEGDEKTAKGDGKPDGKAEGDKPEDGEDKSDDKQPDKDAKQAEDVKRPQAQEKPNRDDVGGPEGAKEHFAMSPTDRDENGTPDCEEGKQLALFDFDGTLIVQDSLDLFIREVTGGWLASRLKILPAFITAFVEAVMTRDDYMDYRSAIKAHWMINSLKGLSLEDAQAAAQRVAKKLDWRDKLVADLKRFAESGADVVIASGALDIIIKELIKDLPVTALICSHAEVEDGKLTGRMTGKEKHQVNVVRGEKRFRTQAYLNERGPFSRVVGYGNMPDDGPMLSLCDEFYIV